MSEEATAIPRRQQILEALAREIESRPASRITTARLASVVGVSEAALYRHFSGKAEMFEALIAFAEETVFALINRILGEEQGASAKIARIAELVLAFSERNPGITRVLLGEALVGEQSALYERVARFFQRLETQVRIVLRDAEDSTAAERGTASVSANLIVAWIVGRMHQFSTSNFSRAPTGDWSAQWQQLERAIFDRQATR